MCQHRTARRFNRACCFWDNRNRLNSVAGLTRRQQNGAMTHKFNIYADLLQQIRNDLRLQPPEWIQPNGQSPICDSYEARLIKSLSTSAPARSSRNMVAVSDLPTLANAKNSSFVIFS